MIVKGRNTLIILVSLLLVSCGTVKEITSESEVSGSIVHYGLINGLPEGTLDDRDRPINFEASAVTNLGDRILIANDKFIPESVGASVVAVPVQKKWPTVLNAENDFDTPLLGARKIESMAKSPNFDLYFAATAFDRIKPDGSWDNYNMLFYWEGKDYDKARVLIKSVSEEGMVSSKNLREALHRVVKNRKYYTGVSYFKVEGMAVLPDNTLILGIREMGPSYEDFDYTCMLVATKFIKTGSGMTINPEWRKIYEFDPKSHPAIQKSYGLSSLEYHPESNSLVALTTYEEEDRPHETLVWLIPVVKRWNGYHKPVLVTDANGNPLRLPYKGEGCTFLDKNSLMIVFDEDRVESKLNIEGMPDRRSPHQAIFGILDFKF